MDTFIPYTRKTKIPWNISVFFVGLSHKCGKHGEVLEAFCDSTNSGKVISEILRKSNGIAVYMTNLVEWVPIDDQGKIRYPNLEEKQTWLVELEKDIKTYKPKQIFCFGKQVSDFVVNNISINNVKIISVEHPSYIAIYKRKHMEEYIVNICAEMS
jgi:hypothetical protein